MPVKRQTAKRQASAKPRRTKGRSKPRANTPSGQVRGERAKAKPKAASLTARNGKTAPQKATTPRQAKSSERQPGKAPATAMTKSKGPVRKKVKALPTSAPRTPRRPPRPPVGPQGAPDLQQAQEAFASFCTTIAWLRDPEKGCPWDLKQSHETLRRYMIEEAYEAAEAMAGGRAAEIQDELGDVLLQVVLNAQIARDAGTFAIDDVIRGIDAKMRRRHPHVFAPEATHAGITSDEVRSNWDLIKADEKAARGVTPDASGGFFAEALGKQPATLQALKIGKLAAKIRFDWESPAEVFAQLRSEVAEVQAELEQEVVPLAKVAEEIGDVYFTLAQLCRHLALDPEVASVDANRKFLRRFTRLEELALSRGLPVTEARREELEQLWQDVKDGEKRLAASGTGQA